MGERGRLVYTSDPEAAKRLRDEGKMPEASDAPPASQTIRVALDRKKRKGKTVTVASGFRLTDASLQKLAKTLKQRCAAGGSAADGEIEIQGEHGDTVAAVLEKEGYRVKRS